MNGRRKIVLHLEEEVVDSDTGGINIGNRPSNRRELRESIWGHIRRNSTMFISSQPLNMSNEQHSDGEFHGNLVEKYTEATNNSYPSTESRKSQHPKFIDHGSMSVSWFVGTSASDLQQSVRSSVIRRLKVTSKTGLMDIRLLDESFSPPEGEL
jgi:hypothetical protein